jgi:hypothetical protein
MVKTLAKIYGSVIIESVEISIMQTQIHETASGRVRYGVMPNSAYVADNVDATKKGFPGAIPHFHDLPISTSTQNVCAHKLSSPGIEWEVAFKNVANTNPVIAIVACNKVTVSVEATVTVQIKCSGQAFGA